MLVVDMFYPTGSITALKSPITTTFSLLTYLILFNTDFAFYLTNY